MSNIKYTANDHVEYIKKFGIKVQCHCTYGPRVSHNICHKNGVPPDKKTCDLLQTYVISELKKLEGSYKKLTGCAAKWESKLKITGNPEHKISYMKIGELIGLPAHQNFLFNGWVLNVIQHCCCLVLSENYKIFQGIVEVATPVVAGIPVLAVAALVASNVIDNSIKIKKRKKINPILIANSIKIKKCKKIIPILKTEQLVTIAQKLLQKKQKPIKNKKVNKLLLCRECEEEFEFDEEDNFYAMDDKYIVCEECSTCELCDENVAETIKEFPMGTTTCCGKKVCWDCGISDNIILLDGTCIYCARRDYAKRYNKCGGSDDDEYDEEIIDLFKAEFSE